MGWEGGEGGGGGVGEGSKLIPTPPEDAMVCFVQKEIDSVSHRVYVPLYLCFTVSLFHRVVSMFHHVYVLQYLCSAISMFRRV